jgi:hypothetical protein
MTEIQNGQLLTDRFGRWPSFHDAEVVSARFERRGADAPFLECGIHVFEMTGAVNSTGYYVLKNHTLVTLRFCDIILEGFQGWNQQNVLFDLLIGPAQQDGQLGDDNRPIEVEMSSSFGCSAGLTCRAVKVLKVEDFTVERNR